MAKIYIVKVGLPDPLRKGWSIDCGHFETTNIKEAEEVATFFQKRGYLVELYKSKKIRSCLHPKWEVDSDG